MTTQENLEKMLNLWLQKQSLTELIQEKNEALFFLEAKEKMLRNQIPLGTYVIKTSEGTRTLVVEEGSLGVDVSFYQCHFEVEKGLFPKCEDETIANYIESLEEIKKLKKEIEKLASKISETESSMVSLLGKIGYGAWLVNQKEQYLIIRNSSGINICPVNNVKEVTSTCS